MTIDEMRSGALELGTEVPIQGQRWIIHHLYRLAAEICERLEAIERAVRDGHGRSRLVTEDTASEAD